MDQLSVGADQSFEIWIKFRWGRIHMLMLMLMLVLKVDIKNVHDLGMCTFFHLTYSACAAVISARL